HCVDLSAAHGTYTIPRLPTINADTDRIDQFLTAQIVEAIEPAIVTHPLVVPGVKLHEVQLVQPGILQTAMNIFFDVIGWIRLHQRRFRLRGPLQIFWRDLRSSVKTLAGI